MTFFNHGHFKGFILITLILLSGCGHKDIEERMNFENKKSADSVYRVGYSMFKAGDLATASRMFKQALSINPQHIPSLIGLAQVARQTRHVQDTSILLQKALVAHPENTSLMLELAKLYIVDNDGARAETLLRDIVTKDSTIDAFNALGVALDLQQKHEEAQKFYKRGLKIDPHHVGVLSNMGLSLALAGRYNESLGFLVPLLRRDHPSQRDRQNVALVYALAGQYEQARKIYKLDLDDKSVEGNLATIEKLSERLLEQSYNIDTQDTRSNSVPVNEPTVLREKTPIITEDLYKSHQGTND